MDGYCKLLEDSWSIKSAEMGTKLLFLFTCKTALRIKSHSSEATLLGFHFHIGQQKKGFCVL
jgi:hypothetical protein